MMLCMIVNLVGSQRIYTTWLELFGVLEEKNQGKSHNYAIHPHYADYRDQNVDQRQGGSTDVGNHNVRCEKNEKLTQMRCGGSDGKYSISYALRSGYLVFTFVFSTSQPSTCEGVCLSIQWQTATESSNDKTFGVTGTVGFEENEPEEPWITARFIRAGPGKTAQKHDKK